MTPHKISISDFDKNSIHESIIASSSDGKRLLIRTHCLPCITSEYVVQQRINDEYVDIKVTWSLSSAIGIYNFIKCGIVC